MRPGSPKSNSNPSGRRFLLPFAISIGVVIAAIAAGTFVGRHWAAPGNVSADNSSGRFLTGERLTYRVSFDTTSLSNFGALLSPSAEQQPVAVSPFGLSHLFKVGLEGELSIIPLESNGDYVVLACQFRDPQVNFQADGMDEPDQSQAMRVGLSQPIFYRLDRSGRIDSLRFDSANNSVTQRIASTLLGAMQIVMPESGGRSATVWDVEEQDPSGNLMAHYEVKTNGSIHKTKPRYLQPSSLKKSKTIQLVPSIQSDGEYVATFFEGHCLSTLSVVDTQTISVQNKVVGNGILKLELRLLHKEPASSSELAQLRSAATDLAKTAKAVTLYNPNSPEQSRINIERQQLGADTLETLLQTLKAAEVKSTPTSDSTSLFLKFKALAFIRPDSCAALGDLLSQAENGSLRMQILTDALEAAGNPQAQTALAAATLNRIADWKATQMLLPALGDVDSPTENTVEKVSELAYGPFDDNIHTTARLALGNAARSLGEESPARAEKIVDRLTQELKDSKNPSTSWELLLALGNAGSAKALPALIPYLEDPASNLRGAATWALRWVDSLKVDPLLIAKAQTDQDSSVRLEAVRALHYRVKTLEVIAAQKQAFAHESEPDVRIELLGNLWDAREQDPEAKEIVERAATNDPAEAVRDTATRLLKGPEPVQ